MARKPIPKDKRIQVWNKYGHHCAYCGCELEYKDMQVDHLNSVYGAEYCDRVPVDNSLDNLMPSCRMCNYYKSSRDLDQFRSALGGMLMNNVRRPFDYRLAVKYGLIYENIHPIRFYFELCESNDGDTIEI